LICFRAKVNRDSDKLVLRRVELRDWLVALSAIGFNAQRNRCRYALSTGVGREESGGDCRNLR